MSRSALDAMITVLADVLTASSPAPTLVPSPQGHLQAEWHLNGRHLEVEVVDPTHIAVDYEGPEGNWTEVISLDLRRLVRAIDRLSAC